MITREQIELNGFGVARGALSADDIESWRAAIAPLSSPLARNLLSIASIASLVRSKAIRTLVEPVAGPEAAPVRGLLFKKCAEENWGVGWHQDKVIAVARRPEVDLPGFGSWSEKEGVPHVCPPVNVLDSMITLRLALDDADADNGALQVIPGSHRSGFLDSDSIKQCREDGVVETCDTLAGDALMMRPLLLHASAKAESTRLRRVVHLEFARVSLPPPLAWPEW